MVLAVFEKCSIEKMNETPSLRKVEGRQASSANKHGSQVSLTSQKVGVVKLVSPGQSASSSLGEGSTAANCSAQALQAGVGGAGLQSVMSRTKNTVGGLASKGCCFCWCCCCSCSCLTVKNGEDSKSQSKEASLAVVNERENAPTTDELLEWSESFDKLMAVTGGRSLFGEYLRTEYSEENMLFWLACESLKTDTIDTEVEERARLIYEDYISILSPKEVSLDSRVREVINRNMVEPTAETFNEAQLQIYTLMHRDSYPRFLNSELFKKMLKQSGAISTQDELNCAVSPMASTPTPSTPAPPATATPANLSPAQVEDEISSDNMSNPQALATTALVERSCKAKSSV